SARKPEIGATSGRHGTRDHGNRELVHRSIDDLRDRVACVVAARPDLVEELRRPAPAARHLPDLPPPEAHGPPAREEITASNKGRQVVGVHTDDGRVEDVADTMGHAVAEADMGDPTGVERQHEEPRYLAEAARRLEVPDDVDTALHGRRLRRSRTA